MRELEYEYYLALRAKHPKAAVLTEVTVTDEEASKVYHSALAARSPYYRRKFKKQGIECDSVVPDGYDPSTAKTRRRIDYLIFEGQTVTAVEMKVSRADFKRDTEEKRQAWKRITNRFIYLTPKGLLKPEEIPAGCGLWEMTPTGQIVTVKKATRNPNPEPMPASMVKYFAWRAFVAEKSSIAIRRSTSRVKRRRR